MTALRYADDFELDHDRVWLNCAHQGPLPRAAVAAAREALDWKINPFELTTERFSGVPVGLKRALGNLIGAPPEEIILGNSASYGIHLLANGIPWRVGDEVLLVRGDFPSVTLPWLGLADRGVQVRFIEPAGPVVEPEEVRQHIRPATRLFCTTWVHSFTGYAVDLAALGDACHSHDVRFVANCAQGMGARPFHAPTSGVDAITSVGFKWLCGPYGTGFCWMKPDLLASLEYNQRYWLARQTADDLQSSADPDVADEDLGARAYDVFGTANFMNFKPWTASIEYLLEQGIERITEHDQRLVSRFIDGLDEAKYDLLSAREGPVRSTLVYVSHKQPDRNPAIYEKLREDGIYVAHRRGRIRVAPHLYNTDEDINRLVAALDELS